MPKIKTHSGAKKRFSVTGSGKVKFQHTNKRHRLTQKDHKRRESCVVQLMQMIPTSRT